METTLLDQPVTAEYPHNGRLAIMTYDCVEVIATSGVCYVDVDWDHLDDLEQDKLATMLRLAACWNALRGIPTDDLKNVCNRFQISDGAARLRYLADVVAQAAGRTP